MESKYMKIIGPKENISVDPTAKTVSPVIFNASSGKIIVGKYAFFGSGVMLLAGSHDYTLKGKERQDHWYTEGYDIKIGEGTWISSGVLILGPCIIGDNAVIGAGSVVHNDIPANELWYGNPIKFIRKI